jgi:hypothetical protein
MNIKSNGARKSVFWFHYNKPASRAAGKPQVSIHYRGSCYVVDNIECDVPIWGHINKRQPYFVMKGKCSSMVIAKNRAIVF